MKNNKLKTINKISASWKPLGRIPKIYANDVFKMRKMQVDAFNSLIDKPYAIINAPTASGKTLAICWVIAKRLHDNPHKKAIIAVPQTIIADGFKGFCNLKFVDENDNLVLDKDITIPWSPMHYLCQDTQESNISQIHSFLSRKGNKNDINDRILICSHASLVNSFQKHRKLFKDIIICIDEAHHVQYSEIEESDSEASFQFCNQMGSLISYALKNTKRNIELFLSTATLFRGDRAEIIPQKYLNKFESFYYAMDDYLKDMPKDGLSSFSYDFAMYENVWGRRLKDDFENGVGKAIIYLPNVGSKYYSYGSKDTDVREIYKSISGRSNPSIKYLDNGLILVKRKDKWIKVVNLVDDSNLSLRKIRKELIIEAHKNKDDSLVDIIITLNMFREGANWKWADRCFILGTKGSLTDIIQIMGRLFRYAPNKKHVSVVQYLPFSFDQIDHEAFKYNLNEYSKVIFATMLLEDIVSPKTIKIPVKTQSTNGVTFVNPPAIDYLMEQVKDANKVLKIWKEIRNEAITVQDNGEVNFGTNNKKTKSKFAEITKSVLKSNNVNKYHEEIAEQIRKRWMRESLKATKNIVGIHLDAVDFDIIDINPLQFWLTYTSGMCGLDTFRKFREASDAYCFLPFKEAKIFVNSLALRSNNDWREYCKSGKPDNIPFNPERVYGKEWISWGDWLGTNSVADHLRDFLIFEKARNFVRTLGLKSQNEWKKYCNSGKRPDNIPACPNSTYKDCGWKGMGDWLGTGITRNKNFLSFEEARNFVRMLKLKNWEDWLHYCKSGKKPDNVPIAPVQAYKNSGWEGIGDWLGTEYIATKNREYLSFEKARKFVRELGFTCRQEWEDYCKSGKKPDNVPSQGREVYNNDWISWGDWLGTGYVATKNREYLSFEKAQKWVIKLGLKNEKEWRIWKVNNTRPLNIPACPEVVYKNKGWEGYKYWLTGKI